MDLTGIVVGQDDRVGAWVGNEVGFAWYAGKGHTVGLEDENGELIAGLVFEDCSGPNCFAHIAIAKGRKATKNFLFYGFYYPFVELGCSRITGMIQSVNKEAVRLNIALGMELEAVLYEACPGGHLLVYRMFKKDCKWLELGEHYGRQQQTTEGA